MTISAKISRDNGNSRIHHGDSELPGLPFYDLASFKFFCFACHIIRHAKTSTSRGPHAAFSFKYLLCDFEVTIFASLKS